MHALQSACGKPNPFGNLSMESFPLASSTEEASRWYALLLEEYCEYSIAILACAASNDMFSLQSAEGVLGHGQWWRLGTCHFMHIHPAHLAINMMSLWNMRGIEEDFGKARYLCVYTASCISCSLLSLWCNPRQSVGASGEYSVHNDNSSRSGSVAVICPQKTSHQPC